MENNNENISTKNIKIIKPLDSRITTVHLPELPTFEDTNSQNTTEEERMNHDQCSVQVIPAPTTFNFDE